MRRNLTSGSASSRLSSQRQGSDPKTQICQCSCQPAQASPSGHFRHTGCLCNDLDEPFDCLKDAFLGQFGKSKWQSYFELLRLPMEMQDLKPSVLIGSSNSISLQEFHLTQSFPCDVFYLPTAFHLRSSSSWQPQDGRGHCEGCGALWDVQGGHNPMVAAAMTQCSRRPAPKTGSEVTK
jgi:hypothetical protein